MSRSVHDLNQPVVLDLGSGLTKGGYAASPDPSVIIGTVVGRPKLQRVLPSADAAPDAAGAAFVGDRLAALSGVVALHHPMHRGVVRDWPAAEDVWRHVSADVLAVAHGEHPFLVTENALNPRPNRERLAEFFFEALNAPSLCVALPPVLALYASGRTSGLVVDVGDTLTTVVPVAHGHVAAHAVQRLDLGGRDVSERLGALLRKSGASLVATSSERQAVRRLKERFCYVARRPRDEERAWAAAAAAAAGTAGTAAPTAAAAAARAPMAVRATLPDGNELLLGAERFRAPEILFRPELVGAEAGGVGDAVRRAVQRLDLSLRAPLLRAVLLSGGGSVARGFAGRMVDEVRAGCGGAAVRVYAPRERLVSAFAGGAVLASLSTTFGALAVSRGEYFERGPGAVHGRAL